MQILNKSDRLYQCPVPLIAITGSIASGKSSVTKILREQGYHVICADELVKIIYSQKETLEFIESVCPKSIQNEKIDFSILRKEFFNSNELKLTIENFIYKRMPEVFSSKLQDIERLEKERFIFYDIPLLFEKEMTSLFDTNVCIYAPEDVLIERLIKRDSISRSEAQKILNNQISIEKKKLNSNHVIKNIFTLRELKSEVNRFLDKIIKEG